jgi:hypothetical protein
MALTLEQLQAIRQFYVGVTRTRETLYLCQRKTGRAVAR